MQSNTNSDESSYVLKGRESLERGDIASAVEFYSKAFDPEALDEPEARNMLIEARANLSRKFIPEALDSFEEALIVGDKIEQRKMVNIIKTMESELGRELRYSTFETKEFQYRFGMYDKLIRDVLDYPHQKIINKMGIV